MHPDQKFNPPPFDEQEPTGPHRPRSEIILCSPDACRTMGLRIIVVSNFNILSTYCEKRSGYFMQRGKEMGTFRTVI